MEKQQLLIVTVPVALISKTELDEIYNRITKQAESGIVVVPAYWECDVITIDKNVEVCDAKL